MTDNNKLHPKTKQVDGFKVVRQGVLTPEDLTNLVHDYVVRLNPSHAGCSCGLDWEVREDGLWCRYTVYAGEADLEPANTDPENLRVAKEVLTAVDNVSVVRIAKDSSHPDQKKALNHLMGLVMQGLHSEAGLIEPEVAFELVVNLIGVSFEK